MTLACIAASHRDGSYNRALVHLAAGLLAEGAGVDAVEEWSYDDLMLPPYDDRLCQPALPEAVQALGARVQAVQGLVLAVPEYNWSYPGSLKNTIDWLSRLRPQPFTGKTALLLSASTAMAGGVRGLLHLRVPLEALGVRVYPQVFALADAANALSPEGTITVPVAARSLKATVAGYLDYHQRLTGTP